MTETAKGFLSGLFGGGQPSASELRRQLQETESADEAVSVAITSMREAESVLFRAPETLIGDLLATVRETIRSAHVTSGNLEMAKRTLQAEIDDAGEERSDDRPVKTKTAPGAHTAYNGR